jgi:DNA-binding NtrC family response regulator
VAARFIAIETDKGLMTTADESATKKPKILVVDDEEGIRDCLATVLAMEGYEVVTAATGAQAIETLSRQSFDVAITDLRMPGMDGIQTLAAMKKIAPDIQVIIATAFASEEMASNCDREGAFEYLLKPFRLDHLIRTVHAAVQVGHPA